MPFFGEFHLVFTRGGAREDVIATIVDPTMDGGMKVHIDSPDRAIRILPSVARAFQARD